MIERLHLVDDTPKWVAAITKIGSVTHVDAAPRITALAGVSCHSDSGSIIGMTNSTVKTAMGYYKPFVRGHEPRQIKWESYNEPITLPASWRRTQTGLW